MKLLPTDLSEKLPLKDGGEIIRIKITQANIHFPKEEKNRNVFRVDKDGKTLWRIAYHECLQGDDPFVGIDVHQDGTVTGLTWDGWQFEINLADGSLKKIGWTKS